jgi:hypothetical protein
MHIKVETKRFDATPAEWLKVGAQCGELANVWSDRGDIVAFVGKGAGMGVAAALWNPILAEMELAVDEAFGEGAKPEFIGDLTERDTQFDHPVAAGAILHESMHARHTKMDFKAIREYKDKRIAMLVEMFEEIRIESRGVENWPRNRAFLRACALKLVTADMEEAAKEAEAMADALRLSRLMILTMGRGTAGVLDDVDYAPVTKAANTVLGEKLVGQLVELMDKAQANRVDHDWKVHKKLAEKWLKLLEDAGHKTEPSEEEKAQARAIAEALKELLGDPEPGEGGGSPMPGTLGEMAEEVEIAARTEAMDQAEEEAAEREAESKKESADEKHDAEEQAKKTFGKGTTDFRGATRSRLHEERPPTDKERAAAITLGKELEKARYRDRVVVRRNSQIPPGRLRGRAAVQGAAVRDRGLEDRTEPWAAKRRYHVEDPKLTIAMMTDVSGSRGHAMLPSSVANYVVSEAGRRIQATVASVYYGNSVFPGLAPGEHHEKVRIFTAPDSTERFDAAFKALNGRVNLLQGSGARLLFVISDLHYTPEERKAARKWFSRCAETGVGVVVLPFNDRASYSSEITDGLPVRIVDDVPDAVSAALQIGRISCQALEAVGNRA